jgi:hypothetical protein
VVHELDQQRNNTILVRADGPGAQANADVPLIGLQTSIGEYCPGNFLLAGPDLGGGNPLLRLAENLAAVGQLNELVTFLRSRWLVDRLCCLLGLATSKQCE